MRLILLLLQFEYHEHVKLQHLLLKKRLLLDSILLFDDFKIVELGGPYTLDEFWALIAESQGENIAISRKWDLSNWSISIDVNSDISIPVTISHEIAHQIGYAFEDEANYIAIETLSKSENNYLRYSGNLMAVQYLLAEIRKIDPELHKLYIKDLNVGVVKNIQQKNEYYLKYQNKYESFFKKNYDIFLKINNQKAGIKTYSLVVDLLINNYQSKI